MPVESETTKHLKEWYKKARGSGLILNFALALGKKDDGMMIFVDRRKPAKKLLLDAKDEGETNKFAYGTMRVQKDEVYLTCEKKPPAGLAKRVKKYFKLIKLPGAPSRVIINDESGQTLEADGEVADQTDDATATPDQKQTDPSQAKWETGIAKLKPKAVERIKAGGPIAEKLRQALKMGRVRAEAGDYVGALKTLPAIVKLLGATDDQPEMPETKSEETPKPKADPGPAKQFQARRAEIMPMLSAAMKQGNPHVDDAQAALKQALEQAKAKDFAAGLTHLETVATILSQPIPERPALEPTHTEDTDLPEDPSELEGRLIMTARALQKSDLPPPEVERLSKALTRAGALLKKGDEVNCEKLLDLVANALSAPTTDPKPTGREIAALIRDVWDDANKTVGGKLEALRKALKEIDDPNCQELADKGLASFTGGLHVKLNSSILELQGAGPDKVDTACQTADDTFRAFQQMLDSHEAVQLIDKNEFGLTVGLGSTLGKALGQMRDIVRDPAAATT